MWLHLASWHLVIASTELPSRCTRFGKDFYAQSERDFAPFHHLSILDAQRAKNNCRAQGEACFVVQIYDNEIYISEEQQGFQSRNQLTMAMLQRVKAKFDLPDAEFVVDTSDGYSHMEAPIFVIAKFPSSPGGILYPDFSSYAWPESECPDEPKGSHVWARAVKRIDAALPEWSQKTDQLLLGLKSIARWWFEMFDYLSFVYCHPDFGEMIQFNQLFSDGLKPSTRFLLIKGAK